MTDPVTLEQLRAFLAVVEEGSFSAAARRLKRVQSAVSHAIAALEQRLGLTLLDRSTRNVALTPQGEALLVAARRVCAQADSLRGLAIELRGGLEPAVSLCVDALFPLAVLVSLCRGFATRFPSVQLRVHTETLSSVVAMVQGGVCDLAVASAAVPSTGLDRYHLMMVEMVPVVSASHPLAARRSPIEGEVLRGHTQIVLSERGGERNPDHGVLSPHTWRVADLGSKHALLLGGLGWGNMPRHMIQDDLRAGRLFEIRPEAWAPEEHRISLSVVHRPGLVMGPATRWFLQEMKSLCGQTEQLIQAPDPRPKPSQSPATKPEAPPKELPPAPRPTRGKASRSHARRAGLRR